MELLEYYKKLVEHCVSEWGRTCGLRDNGNCECVDFNVLEHLQELKAYKDAEEQGLLMRLPCKVGDTVYTVNSLSPTRHVIAEVETDAFFLMLSVAEGRIGKTVFLTREEAEKTLAEMKGM